MQPVAIARLPALTYLLAVQRPRRRFVQRRATFVSHKPRCQLGTFRNRAGTAFDDESKDCLAQVYIACGDPHDRNFKGPPFFLEKPPTPPLGLDWPLCCRRWTRHAWCASWLWNGQPSTGVARVRSSWVYRIFVAFCLGTHDVLRIYRAHQDYQKLATA